MNPGNIWWGQIGSSLRLLTDLSEYLRDGRSVVLSAPALPWRQEFRESLELRRTAFGTQRRLVCLRWREGADPGRFVLDELCPERVRADYWPGRTCAEYLGGRDDLLMNDCDVWITGIRSRGDLTAWTEFACGYRRAAAKLDSCAVFILEYAGSPAEIPGLEQVACTVERHDCRVFALEAAAALGNAARRDYQAELALSVCGADPELCFALLLTGERLVRDPEGTAARVLEEARASDGRPFAAMAPQQIHSAVWEASVVLLFPVLERCRLELIGRNSDRLACHLPISNSNGDRVTDVCDLEIGNLYYIMNNGGRTFSPEDAETVRLCRSVRNLLAHNRLAPYPSVEKLLALKA